MKPTPIKYKINTERTKYFRLVFCYYYHNMLKYYYYYTIYPNTTIMTEYSKILLLSHSMLKYFYYHT